MIFEGIVFAAAELLDWVFPLEITNRLEERREAREDRRNWAPPR
jgi:hypothetical protein